MRVVDRGYNASTMKATRILRRPRVLIVGCGDVGMRCVRQLQGRARLYALTSHAERRDELRAAGVTPIVERRLGWRLTARWTPSSRSR